MNLLVLANFLFLCFWLVIVFFTYTNKKRCFFILKLIWIPIGIGIAYFMVLFFQMGQFPITNLRQFSLALLFLLTIPLAIVSLKNKELGAYCFSLYLPIYLVSSFFINENFSFIADFSSYSQLLLIFHIGFVLIGQLLFTISFILAILNLRQFLKKKYSTIIHLMDIIGISIFLMATIVIKQYFLFLFFILFILLLKIIPKSFIIKEEKLLMYARWMVTLGMFFFFTGAIIFGMIWANIAWGRFWAWDPKETWALITLLTYNIFIHWQPKTNKIIKSSLFLIVAFILLMFNFIYINFFIEGLHSYAFETQMFFTNV